MRPSIKELAHEAAAAAHDVRTPEFTPTAAMALAFIINARYEAELDAEPIRLTEAEEAEFTLYYDARLQELADRPVQ